ncbi:6,7-dimethyl-8-ribityllumazine synthase [Jimgerdemannia flammicorona]|uniref:6,7-dimethyl-8-ribityllumazine synthase n=1 Tax=Jimgerdemannia flammicorona TaxID=994334 RepID=A0A433DDC9_9FUNG|nr:6,7-dimethyl-8-ribityllumazine synthase [Jimgerdemannia flammicorona]
MAEFQKGVLPPTEPLDGSPLRVLIVHARWNYPIVESLVNAARDTMINKYKVLPDNVAVHAVPGAYELPFAAQRLIISSQQQAAHDANDLIGAPSVMDLLDNLTPTSRPSSALSTGPGPARHKEQAFDAVICIGVLIKGSTMHFEYICEAVSQGIIRVGLDSGIPVIFGVLTCLDDDQALVRAGLGRGQNGKGHNHGEDWGAAAVEMALLKDRKL